MLDEVSKLYLSGMSTLDISKQLCIPRHKVYRKLNENKISVSDSRVLDKKPIIELFKEGLSTREIAIRLNLIDSSVRRVLKKEGLVRTIREHNNISRDDIDVAIKRYIAGEGCKKIAKDFNFSEKLLYTELITRGIEVRSRSEANCLSNTLKSKRGIKGSVLIRGALILFESFYELLFLIQMDLTQEVLNIKRSKDIIKYKLDDKIKHYNPDFIITYKNGTEIVYEVKPKYKLEDMEVVAKAEASKIVYESYKVVTEEFIEGKYMRLIEQYTVNTKEDLEKYIKRYKNIFR